MLYCIHTCTRTSCKCYTVYIHVHVHHVNCIMHDVIVNFNAILQLTCTVLFLHSFWAIDLLCHSIHPYTSLDRHQNLIPTKL